MGGRACTHRGKGGAHAGKALTDRLHRAALLEGGHARPREGVQGLRGRRQVRHALPRGLPNSHLLLLGLPLGCMLLLLLLLLLLVLLLLLLLLVLMSVEIRPRAQRIVICRQGLQLLLQQGLTALHAVIGICSLLLLLLLLQQHHGHEVLLLTQQPRLALLHVIGHAAGHSLGLSLSQKHSQDFNIERLRQ